MEALFPKEDQARILEAIKESEKETSGEIRVHLEKTSGKLSAFDRAVEVFISLKMDQTAAHNGVLIYLAVNDHAFAIIGDKGINEVVPHDFWESTRNVMEEHFRNKKFSDGLVLGIRAAGKQLQAHFPFKSDDKDELSNDISFGK
jgi:uncharacterized membrane protein